MRHLTKHLKIGIINSCESGAPISQVRINLVKRFGGNEHFILTDKDIQHVIDEERRLKMEGGDAKAMMTYFEGMQKANSNFYHAHRLNNTGHLQDIMWVDARSRASFTDFGDVLKDVMKTVVYESLTVDEFDDKWRSMIQDFETTQRVESINSFFDGFFNRHTKLHEFPEKHCIRVLDTNLVRDLPSKYILRIWRKDLYRKHIHVDVG
ncbi:uncharacterized protein [Spinacia oleracea]|uniref:Protein FAR1-RELATED SEQUENCE n=1 Tax=Spinacia oleracea TaxID=3562 RepID=A0ABM3RJE5_SPIOL|nr:uncharacterized protein LOC130470148 [Spinacia oleracea]